MMAIDLKALVAAEPPPIDQTMAKIAAAVARIAKPPRKKAATK